MEIMWQTQHFLWKLQGVLGIKHPFLNNLLLAWDCIMYWLWDWCFMCRGNVRMITSLPVSPSSSPLRSYGPAHQSCYLSPPRTSYIGLGQSSNNLNEYMYNMRPMFTLDPLSSPLKVQTHGGSPRRPLWLNFSWKKEEKWPPHIPRCNFIHGVILSIVYQKYVSFEAF